MRCARFIGSLPTACELKLARSRPSGRTAERGDDAIEEGLRDTLIAQELEHACELARRHVGGHARVLTQYDAQVAPFRERLAARFFDDPHGRLASDLGGERGRR